MQVTISVHRKFHAYALAAQMQRLGYLKTLITSYPRFAVKGEGIPAEKVVSLPVTELLRMCWRVMPGLEGLVSSEGVINPLFDRLASRRVRECDIFTAWSGASIRTLRRAKALGAVTVVERGSSHIEVQRDLLADAYHRFGVKPVLPHPRVIESELAEYREAEYISVPSNFVRDTFVHKGVDAQKIFVIPYGVNSEAFAPASRAPRGKGPLRVCYCGAMSVRKGVPYLLQAVDELRATGCRLLLIGSMSRELKPYFARYRDCITYVGHMPSSRLPELFAQSDVFVLPSVEDGYGLVVLQAMASGLPVICTDRVGGKDAVSPGENGFIVPALDVPALKEKLEFFCRTPEAVRSFSEAAVRTARQLTWERYGERMAAEYARCLSGKK